MRTTFFLGLTLLVACEGDDDTAAHDAGWDAAAVDAGAVDAALADAALVDATILDGPVADAQPVDAPVVDAAPPALRVSWTIKRIGGADGCDGVGLVSVTFGEEDDVVALVPCTDGSAALDRAPEPETGLALRALSPGLDVLGGARLFGPGPVVDLDIYLTGEPLPQLEAMRVGMDAYFASEGQLLDSRAPAPSERCCLGQDDLCEVDLGNWSPYEPIGFSIDHRHRFQYAVTSFGDVVRLSAYGDVDCDSLVQEVFVEGWVVGEQIFWQEPVATLDD